MKALLIFITALSFPIMLLNILGGIVSGIWLAILGEWHFIIVGIVGLFISQFILAFAMMPGLLFMMPAAKFAETKHSILMYFFALLGSIYMFGVITVWLVAVMHYFLHDANAKNVIPLLLWSYGFAIGPLSYMASKERDESSAFHVFFAALAYISAGIWCLLGAPTIQDILILIGSTLAVGVIVTFGISSAKSRWA